MILKKDFHGVLVEQKLIKADKKASFKSESHIAIFSSFLTDLFLVKKKDFLSKKIEEDWFVEGSEIDFALKYIFQNTESHILLVPLESPILVLESASRYDGFEANIFVSLEDLKIENIVEILSIAETARAVFLTDLHLENPNPSVEEIIKKSNEYPKDKRLGLFYPKVKSFGFDKFLPLSFFISRKLMNNSVYESISNKAILGIRELQNPLSEQVIRSELNTNQIGSVFNRGGIFRSCGFYTRFPKSEGLLFQMQIQRTADAIEKSFKDFFYMKIDRGITNSFIENLTLETENFLKSLVFKGVINDFSVKIDKDITNLTEGNLGYEIEIAATPSLEKVVIKQVLSEPLLAKYFEGALKR